MIDLPDLPYIYIGKSAFFIVGPSLLSADAGIYIKVANAFIQLYPPALCGRPLAHVKLGAKAPKGSGSALEPPVAMYFHKKGIEITYIITRI